MSGKAVRRTARHSGNMLLLMSVFGFFIVLVGIVWLSYVLMSSAHDKAQWATDGLAMKIAINLNSGDRIGHFNDLIVHARELVYASRQTADITDASPSVGFCRALSYQLLDESRCGATLAWSEQKKEIAQIELEVISIVDDYRQANSGAAVRIPWLGVSKAQPLDIRLGFEQGVPSNIKHSAVYPELLDYDTQRGYVQRRTNFYKGNVNLALPEPDGDLSFLISSIPAPVSSIISPAALMKPERFEQTGIIMKNGKIQLKKSRYLPSAAMVSMSMPVEMTIGRSQQSGEVIVDGSAVSFGSDEDHR